MLRCLEDGQLEDRMIETDIPASRGVNPLDHLQGSNVQELVIRQAAGAGTCSVLLASLAATVLSMCTFMDCSDSHSLCGLRLFSFHSSFLSGRSKAETF